MKKLAFLTALLLTVGVTFANTSKNEKALETSSNVSTFTVPANISPFCMSIVKGDLETVKKLIELGADVNEKSNGLTPAMYAAKFNRVDILKLLIDKGADLKAKSTKQGFTAVKYAELSNATDAKAILEKALNS
ncbi:ankyrin repeat domain-containing protein [Galbibacter sp. EGI 63066]|uniref:ankyrin repeat domain-containing protein n=1 Tax=Galbibacter sp. EGI 63066 TaxID=2993559 RepID=UPI0022499BAB|nr:ankyrin repeat domain-containing protein [Galbibacter sp. EGI 63066]MCX2680402.1 ankyrin repeat domain-containing protein [Galbibacter sp. EGI 63066]